MSDECDQADEILALKSIYGEKVISCNTEIKPIQGRIMVDVAPLQVSEDAEFKVALEDNSEAVVFLKHLPPITLSFSLPLDYPSTHRPSFSLSTPWLSLDQTKALSEHINELWENNDQGVILFTWYDFLQNEALKFLQLHAVIHSSQEMIVKLSEFNAAKEEKEFKRSIQLCPVCFTDKPGRHCKRLINCNHIFCDTCLLGYLEVGIREGSVAALACMQQECTAQINPADVKSVVGSDMYVRYERLMLQTSLEAMTDVQYCPRKECSCAVIIDREHGLGQCGQCGFSFCCYCHLTYHGMQKCSFQSGDMTMFEKYNGASAEEKKEMEERYGKKKINEMMAACQSIRWIQESTVKCPKCQRCIEKLDGCNKMTCSKCNTCFCWICGQMLQRNNPYSHYADKNGKCYNKLFLGLTTDHDEEEDEEGEDRFLNFWDLSDDEDDYN